MHGDSLLPVKQRSYILQNMYNIHTHTHAHTHQHTQTPTHTQRSGGDKREDVK